MMSRQTCSLILQGQGTRQAPVPLERIDASRGRARAPGSAAMPGKRINASRGRARAPAVPPLPKVDRPARKARKGTRGEPAKVCAQRWTSLPPATISAPHRRVTGFESDPAVEYMLRLEVGYKCEPCPRPPSTPLARRWRFQGAPVNAHRLATLLQRELRKDSPGPASPCDSFILATPTSARTSDLPLPSVLDHGLGQPLVGLDLDISTGVEACPSRDARSSPPAIVHGLAAASLARHLGLARHLRRGSSLEGASSNRGGPADVQVSNVGFKSRDDLLKMGGQDTATLLERSPTTPRARTTGFVCWVPWLHPSGTGGLRPKDLGEWLEEEASRLQGLRGKFGIPKKATSPLMERFSGEIARSASQG